MFHTLRHAIRHHKHAVLLAALVIMALLQPLAHGFVGGLLLFDVVLTIVLMSVVVIIFKRRSERMLALLIAVPALLTRLLAYSLHDHAKLVVSCTHNALIIVFFAFAITVILRGIFEDKVIRWDHFIGTVCGYLLAGAAWGNLFFMIDLLLPGAYSFKPEILSQIRDEHWRHYWFNYLSLCTLTGVGFGDITPVAPLVATLSWFEAMFGEFYIAVVVAQLVGLKLTQAVENRANQIS